MPHSYSPPLINGYFQYIFNGHKSYFIFVYAPESIDPGERYLSTVHDTLNILIRGLKEIPNVLLLLIKKCADSSMFLEMKRCFKPLCVGKNICSFIFFLSIAAYV